MMRDNQAEESNGRPVEDMLRQTVSGEVPEGLVQCMRARLDAFHSALDARDSAAQQDQRSPWFFLRPVTAVATALLVVAIVGSFMAQSATPTWAQVTERFSAVPSCNATIYVKSNPFDEPVQLELWLGEGSKFRMRAGNEMVFWEKGRTIESVPFAPAEGDVGRVREAREMVEWALHNMGDADTFSLETLIRALPVSKTLSTPLEIRDATIAEEMVVFDMTEETHAERVRIWALKRSRLPLRVLYSNPGTGESADVVFSYASRQAEGFFDSEAFKAALNSGDEEAAAGAYWMTESAGAEWITYDDAGWKNKQVVE
jgi:hypothetical protein